MILAALAAVFANALPNGFHLDDYYRIVDNPGLDAGSPWWRHFTDPATSATVYRLVAYRPLLPLTLALNRAVSGVAPGSYRVGNLLVHGAAAILVYLFALALLARGRSAIEDERVREGIALAAALVFAVHPVSGDRRQLSLRARSRPDAGVSHGLAGRVRVAGDRTGGARTVDRGARGTATSTVRNCRVPSANVRLDHRMTLRGSGSPEATP